MISAGFISAILRKAGLSTDGYNLHLYRNGGVLVAGYKQRDMIYNEHATAKWPVGTKLILGDEVYHYAKADGTLVAGDLIQSAVLGGATTRQQDCTVAATAAANAKTLSVTIKVDTLTANQFKNGMLVVSDGAAGVGGGQCFRIKSHPAGSGNVVMTFYDKIPVTITTAAKVGLMANLYIDVVQAPVTTATGAPVGVSRIAVTDNYHFWLQTWGPAAILSGSGAIVAGKSAVVGLEAGAVIVQPGTAEDECVVGDFPMAGDTTDWVPIILRLAA